ncbi:chitinase ChiA [Geobacter sp. OR-1]|nr:chitinase ChiA [Geobacter sp. OR-1]
MTSDKTGQLFYLTYSLSGTVRSGSATGPVLAGATVSIAGKTTTTSATGTFAITGITRGTYSLSISKTGYVPYSNPAYPMTLSKTAQTFYLTPITHALSGTVLSGSATGPVLAGATVAIAGKTAITSATGTFSITGIPEGTYPLTITKAGHDTFSNPSYAMTSDRIGQLFFLTYSLSGTVRSGSATGPVLAGATVSIAGKTTTTSATGTFAITGISAGTYPLTISKTAYYTYTNPAYAMNASKTAQVFTMAPLPTYTLSGTVRSDGTTGFGVAGATVAIAGKTAITGTTGTFSITQIPLGNYPLNISKTGYYTSSYSYAMTASKTGQLFVMNQTTATIVGSWQLFFDWDCDGTIGIAGVSFFSNNTFSTTDGGSGTWSKTGYQVKFTFPSGTAYTGTVGNNTMQGTSMTPTGFLGCWNAVWQTNTPAVSLESIRDGIFDSSGSAGK